VNRTKHYVIRLDEIFRSKTKCSPYRASPQEYNSIYLHAYIYMSIKRTEAEPSGYHGGK